VRRSDFIRDVFCRSGFIRDGLGVLIIQNKSRINSLLHVFLFFILFTTPTFADYQAGLDAYNSGDYATAMAEWKEVASRQPERENLAIYRESLYAIGMLYWQGEGVEQDFGVSVVWLKQAADINHPGAQAKLGYLYSTGQGVPRNDTEALKWFEMAAAQGDPDALHNLEILRAELPTPAPEPDPEPVAPLATPGRGAGERWILAQDPGHYTIQVIALSSPEKLRAFIAENETWAPFAIYGETRFEQPLWVLVQGDYSVLEDAREAARTFPLGIQSRDRLWIRRFEMVQRRIE
jgi:hypothetical protein